MITEKDKLLFNILATVELSDIAASIVANSFLIYLIVNCSSQEIGAYRYLLLGFAVNDIIFPVVHFLTLPVICSYKDAFIMFSHGLLSSRVSICLFACTFSQTMPLLAHLFIYRLLALEWPHYIKYYAARSCFWLVVITLVIESSLWFFNCLLNYGPEQELIDYAQPFLEEEFEGEGQEFIGALYYTAEGKFRMRAFLATMGFNSIMAICMSVIVFCSYYSIVHFRSVHVQWSGKTKNLQKQLFTTLVVQMIIPMVFVYFPCAGIINLPMLGFRLNVFPNLVSASLTIFPVLDAFIIMFGVRSYRMTALFIFKCHKQSKITVSTMSHVHSDVGTSVFVKPN